MKRRGSLPSPSVCFSKSCLACSLMMRLLPFRYSLNFYRKRRRKRRVSRSTNPVSNPHEPSQTFNVNSAQISNPISSSFNFISIFRVCRNDDLWLDFEKPHGERDFGAVLQPITVWTNWKIEIVMDSLRSRTFQSPVGSTSSWLCSACSCRTQKPQT